MNEQQDPAITEMIELVQKADEKVQEIGAAKRKRQRSKARRKGLRRAMRRAFRNGGKK